MTSTAPGARRLFVVSIVARLPLAMFGIAMLVHAQHLTGSYAAAGIVGGAYAVAIGVGGPLLGRLVDRRGQASVLVASAAGAAAALSALALLPAGVPLALPAALAAAAGLATPPLGACMRALVPALITDSGKQRAAYALDASAVEFTWVSGPPLALAVGAIWSTGAALAAGGAVLLLGTVVFAAHPASRGWRPAAVASRPRGGSLRAPAIRTLVLVLLAVGAVFGSVEVAVTAAAEHLGGAAAAAPLMALWGAGSLAGGLLATRLGGGAQGAAGLGLILAGLAGGHLLLAVAAGSAFALGTVLLIAGAAIAPTLATVYAMVDAVAPEGTLTEAFAWLTTATAVGTAAGAAIAGALADHSGATAAFALSGVAGVLAVLITIARATTLATTAPAT
jgi:MFS family permease